MRLVFFLLIIWLCPLLAGEYYVAIDGVNVPGNGNSSSPWKTIAYALQQIPDDGSTITVKDGVYSGRSSLDRHFSQPATVRAENAYKARLENNDRVIAIYDGSNIVIEGFEITHQSAGGALVVHIAGTNVRDITLRNNIFHDSYNNDILKINDLASNITISGNIFYNQAGSDEHMDINQVADVEVTDNIFFNDYAGSGRTITGSQFIVVKNSYGNRPGGSRNVHIRRNIFLNFEGGQWGAFVRYGEDDGSHVEADGCILENNLFLDTSGEKIQAPVNSSEGDRVKNITIRNNTLNGEFPHTLAHSLRANGNNIRVFNNVWCNPSGNMSKWGSGGATNSLLQNNLYWNGGSTVPDGDGTLKPSQDSGARWENPQLPGLSSIVLPRFNTNSGGFDDGSTTIREAFENLAGYAFPGNASAVSGYGDPSELPADDLLGNPRGGAKNLGALTSSGITGISEEHQQFPRQLVLKQNYPNPFNPSTTIEFDLPAAAMVRLEIFDVVGRQIVGKRREVFLPAGLHKFLWSATDDRGNPVASGIYFYQVIAVDAQSGQSSHQLRKMILLR